MEKFRLLQGMRDLPQGSWKALRSVQDKLGELFYVHGYRVLETPLLEPTELYLRKSGGELAARMYSFTDPGGNEVSLRPEYTASIVRHYIEEYHGETLPVRFQYAGPVFRYEGDAGPYRQFTQVGAELLGSSNPRADAEIISLSCMALSSLGVSGHRVEIGDLGIHHRLLESLELSERATAFIVGSLGELKTGEAGLSRIRERAIQLRLLVSDPQQRYISAAIAGMEEGEAGELLSSLLVWTEAGSLGQREPSEVVERLLRKFRGSDDPARLEKGLELAYSLAMVRGDPAYCLTEVATLIRSHGLDHGALEGLTEILELLDPDQLAGAEVVLDFGLARGLDYYTGIIFEITHPGAGTSLGGGGRYDSLARALGSPMPVAALGFAYTLEPLLRVLGQDDNAEGSHRDGTSRVMVMVEGEGSHHEALRVAQELRREGIPVEMEVCGRGLDESLSYAEANGISEVISVDGRGESTTHRVGAGAGLDRSKG